MMTAVILKRALGAAAMLMLTHALAHADTIPAEQAAEMLARAQSVDMKCSYLNATDKDMLSNLVARAELALATREPVEATKATMQRGHAAGLAAACAANEKQAVHSILGVARQASIAPPVKSTATLAATAAPIAADATPVAPPAILPAAPKPQMVSSVPVENDAPLDKPAASSDVATQEPAFPMASKVKTQNPKIRKSVAALPPAKKAKLASGKSGDLQHYAQLTEAYYLALRCSGGGSQVNGLYATIVAVHGNLMQSYGAKQVSSALHSAKARAGSHTCL